MVAPFVPQALQTLAPAPAIENVTGLSEVPPLAHTVNVPPAANVGLAGAARSG